MTLRDWWGRFARKPQLSPKYRRRVERGTAAGKSYAAARGHATRPIRPSESKALYGRQAYEDALTVLARMRRGERLTSASRAIRTSPDTVLRHVGSALQRDEGGRYRAKKADRLYRSMLLLDERGARYVEPANSREGSKLG